MTSKFKLFLISGLALLGTQLALASSVVCKVVRNDDREFPTKADAQLILDISCTDSPHIAVPNGYEINTIKLFVDNGFALSGRAVKKDNTVELVFVKP